MTSTISNDPRNSINGLSSPIANSPTTPVGAAPRSNALTSRITTVLSASYADLEIRDAIDTLDTRGFQNTQESRRDLRLDLQQDVIACNGQIITDFGEVAQQLKRIGDAIKSLNKCCTDMRAQISAAHGETGSVLEEATSLMSQKAQVETKQHMLNAFKSHFVLSETDLAILTSSSEPVNEDFFRVLAKVKTINQDSEFLLGTEDERLGLDILEQSSKQQNAAFQKLYRWLQSQLKTLDLENPQIGSAMRRAIRVLAERPQLFQSLMDAFAESRERILSDAFHAALTGSTAGSDTVPITKPIEFNAHDPLRYVGDMLAWVHSATVSEREALEVLFIEEGEELAKGLKAGQEHDPWSRQDNVEETFDGRRALNELVGRDIAGVARLLKQRTEQVVSSHDDAALAYKIANLVGFYKQTFEKLLSSEARILDTLTVTEASALRQFRTNMQDNVASIQPELEITPSDLAPPEFLGDALETLKSLMKSYEGSYAAINGEEAFQSILTVALGPFLDGCHKLQEKLPVLHQHIFAINCLLLSRDALLPFKFTSSRVSRINETVNRHASKLVDHQYQYLLSSSGLAPLVEALNELSNSSDDIAAITTLEPFEPSNLVAISQTLDDFLPSALMDAMENLKQLRNPRMIREITEEAAERFCQDFEIVEGKILAADDLMQARDDGKDDEGEKKVVLRDLLPRTSGEIRVLLS